MAIDEIVTLILTISDPAAGGTVDYLHGTSKVKYSYTPELRGDGFDVDESEIQPAFEEFWVGLETQVHSMYAIENDLEWQPPKSRLTK